MLSNYQSVTTISVVTISFNQAEFLAATIASVIELRKYFLIEYIVVDPGSTDGSRELILSFEDQIDKVIFEPDKGPADGLNKGFALATGDILCYLNSDDYFLPDGARSMIQALLDDTALDIVYGNCLIVDGIGNKVRKAYSDKFSLFRAAYGCSVVIQPSTFFRRRAFVKAGGFNVDNKSNWDGELMIDMVMTGCVCRKLEHTASAYRIHAAGITGSGKMLAAHDAYRDRMFEKIFKRGVKWIDLPIKLMCLIYKHAIQPKALFERIFRGSVFGSAK